MDVVCFPGELTKQKLDPLFVSFLDHTQAVLHSGQRPTILQQLCTLPFDYFSNEVLKGILFPTFISCCFKNESNRAILEMEMSPVMLSSFLEVS